MEVTIACGDARPGRPGREGMGRPGRMPTTGDLLQDLENPLVNFGKTTHFQIFNLE